MKASSQVDGKLGRRICLWSSLVALTLLASCSAPAMRNQFRNYNEAYAESLNQQMLLNLARLANGHPAYYLAIGLIDQKYTFSSQTGAGVSGGLQETHTSTQNTPYTAGTPSSIASFPLSVFQKVWLSTFGGNGSETVNASSNPEFQFIPINNEAAAKQVLQPMDPNVFLSLYQQGYPIDQLMRIMIERVEVPKLPSGEHLVLVNSPTSGKPEYYERFLRACAMLRTLQLHGYLWLQAQPDLEPLGSVSFSARQARPNGQTEERVAGDVEEKLANPAFTDFAEAESKNMVLTNNEKGWMAYRKRTVPKFFLRYEYEPTPAELAKLEPLHEELATNDNPVVREELATNYEQIMLRHVEPIIRFLEASADYKSNTNDYIAITNLVYALYAGVAIQTDVGQGDPSATRLVLRSFNRTMEAVASEQVGYETLAKNETNFTNMVPEFERRPVLQMIWTNKPALLEPPLERVYYANKTYQITDSVMSPTNSIATWNRDTFRLLVGLNSLVTVDISKFQRQVLELEQ
jgi:hypothetical protein